MSISYLRYFLIICLLVVGGTAVALFLPTNILHIVVSKIFSAGYGSDHLERYLTTTELLACTVPTTLPCQPFRTLETEDQLILLHDNYVDHDLDFLVVRETTEIPLSIMHFGGLSSATLSGDQESEQTITLFGEEYIDIGLYFLGGHGQSWRIAMEGVHDAPPPVKIDVWLDQENIGTLVYGRGDQSVESLSVTVAVEPAYHILRLWYTNDTFDREQQIDRNAYIKSLVLLKED